MKLYIHSTDSIEISNHQKIKVNKMSKLFAILVIGLVVAATLTAAQEPKGSVREKRGYGHGHGGHGHGPGAGGGARGPIYFCGWVGSKEGSQHYGHGK